MKSFSSVTQSVVRTAAKTVFVAGLALGCSLHTEPAKAGLPVIDYTAIANAIRQYAIEAKNWTDTWGHYMQMAQHAVDEASFWQTQLVKLKNLDFQLFTLKHQFTQIDKDFGVEQECPGKSSGGLASVLDTALDKFLPNLNGDVVSQQQDLCVLIVEAKNQKYNDTVIYLDSVATSTSELSQIATAMLPLIGNSPANAAFANTEISHYAQTIETARITWQTNMEQTDAQIKMLQQMQSNLSRRAMNGSPSAFGTLVNVVALKAAFGK